MDIPKFETRKELFTWLKTNQDEIIYQKKSMFKTADCFQAPTFLIGNGGGTAFKDATSGDASEVKVRAIINTTMIRDSHKDVHIDGLWNKSLKENIRIKHLQEHEMKFDKIIADKTDLKAFTKTYEWKQLGYDIEGKTQALVFDSIVKEKRNPVMFKEYKEGNVDNHSVGMYYTNIKMAIDSDDEGDEKEKAEFDKHIDNIANKAEVKKDGFFFAVYEAKAIEGSAVLLGSNPITPTLSTSKNFGEDDEPEADPTVIAIKEWLLK